MKKASIISALLGLACLTTKASDWKQWSVVASPVYTVAISDFKFEDARQGGGVAVEVFALDNLGIQVQGTTFTANDSVVDEASVQLNYYVPVSSTSPFSLVASLGTLRGIELNEDWHYKVGAGVVTKVSEKISGRVGAYLVDDFRNTSELRFEGAVGYTF